MSLWVTLLLSAPAESTPPYTWAAVAAVKSIPFKYWMPGESLASSHAHVHTKQMLHSTGVPELPHNRHNNLPRKHYHTTATHTMPHYTPVAPRGSHSKNTVRVKQLCWTDHPSICPTT